MKKKIICFSGIDGSGKSTHISLLESKLGASGHNFRYIWFRYPKFISFLLLGFCRLLSLNITENHNGKKIWKTGFHKNEAIRRLWPYFQFLDTVVHWLTKVYLMSFSRNNLLFDRSPLDALVDVAYDVRNQKLIKKLIGRLFLYLIFSSSLTIILDSAEDVVNDRKEDVNNILESKNKRFIYKTLARAYDFYIIDTTKPVLEAHDEIMHILKNYFR